MSAEIDIAERLKQLRMPFAENQISKLPKPYKRDSPPGNCKECGGYHGLPAMHLDYVGHAALTDRLLDVDPLWTWEPLALTDEGLPLLDKDGGLWIKLTICGVTRLGYGDAAAKTGPNATKERIGDALRNAGMRFGIALDLWHKGDLHDDAPAQRPTTVRTVSQNGHSVTASASNQPAEEPKRTKAEMRADFETRLRTLRYSGDITKLLRDISKKDAPVTGDLKAALEMDEDAFIAALTEAGVKQDPDGPAPEMSTGEEEKDPFSDDDAPLNSAQTLSAIAR